GDVARSAHADAIGPFAVAERGVVAGRGIGPVIARHPVRAVQEVTVLVDSEAEVGSHHPCERQVRVRAALPATSTHRADVRGLARVHEEEAYAVGPIPARTARNTAGVSAVGDGLEGERDSRTGGEGRCGDDGAVLRVAAGVAVREAQRPLTVRVGKRLGGAGDAVLTTDQILVVGALNGEGRKSTRLNS